MSGAPSMSRDELRALLKAVGLSQAKAAVLLGVTKISVENWASDRHPVPGPAARALRLYQRLLSEGWPRERIVEAMEREFTNSG